LRRGRYFTDQDRQGAQPVVIIDENLARQYWPHQDALGKRMRRGEAPWSTIAGIVGHIRHSELAADSGKGVYYFPLFQQPIRFAALAVKTAGHPTALAGGMRQSLRAVDPHLPLDDLKTMEERIAASLGPRRFAMTLLAVFASLALLMAAIGLYGLISFSVTQRTQEIGIRMALGAPRRAVLGLVVGQGLRLAGAGVLLGLAAAYALARLLSTQLFQVPPFDPLTFLVMAAVLLLVALLASYLPARRAMKVDPAVALRHE